MKNQLLILTCFIVASCAGNDNGDGKQYDRRHFHRGRYLFRNRSNTNTESGRLEESLSSGEMVTEGIKGHNCEHGWIKGSSIGMNERTQRRQFDHNPEWHQKHGIQMPNENTEDGNKNERRYFHSRLGRNPIGNRIIPNTVAGRLEDSLSSEKAESRECESGPSVGMDEGAHPQQFVHNSEWHQKNGIPMPDENTDVGKKHHRHHHHRHHHHHHRNHTTTTTTTTSSPLSEVEGVVVKQQQNDFHDVEVFREP